MKKLLAQRDQIDRLDEKISKLLIQRLDLSQEIIRTKKRYKLPVTDAERENEIFDKVSEARKPAQKNYLLQVYKTILRQTKKPHKA